MKTVKRLLWVGGAAVLVCVCVALVAIELRYRSVQAALDGDDAVEIEVDGRTRSFYVHTPPAHNTEPNSSALPVLIGFHGGGGSAAGFAEKTGFSAVADELGVIVVYPNGTTLFPRREILQTWNAGNCCAYALDNDIDDIAFLDAMLDYVLEHYNADPASIYLTGHSNGGMLSYRAACELSERITGIAPVAGAQNVSACEPQRPLDILIIHGTDDQHVLYEGGRPRESVGDAGDRVDTAVATTRDFWVAHNQCSAEPVVVADGDVLTERFVGCAEAVRVQVVSLQGGGHSWPGSDPRRSVSDPPFADYDATREIMRFAFENTPTAE